MLHFFIRFICCVLLAPNLAANIPRFQTTRLKSTAGAGVASFVIDEATLLNPAPLSFFNLASFYFQKSGGEFKDEERQVTLRNTDQMAFIISDTTGPLKGSASYAKLSYGDILQQQMGISLAALIGQQSSLGLTYRKTEQEDISDKKEKTFDQLVVGVLHAITPEFTMGFVLADPLGKIEEDRKGILGVQYVYKEFISLMLDVGADYEREMSKSFVHKGAIQIKLFTDFYGRFGAFRDRGLANKGTGTGLSWIGPKLILDFSLNHTQYKDDIFLKQIQSNQRETSFSVSYRF